MGAGRGEILEDDLSPALRQRGAGAAASALGGPGAPGGASTLEEKIAHLERHEIAAALAATQGNRSHSAARLGLSRQGLLNKMERYGLK